MLHRTGPRWTVTPAARTGFVVVWAVAAALSMAWPDWMVVADARPSDWSYAPGLWPLLTICAGAAVFMLRNPRPAVVVTAIVAAQVAANSLVVIRHYFAAHGLGMLAMHGLAAAVAYALAVVLTPIAALVAVAVLLWRERVRWRSLIPARPGYVLTGIAVALLLPASLHVVPDSLRYGGYGYLAAWTFSLPWGTGLAAAAWLRVAPAAG